LHIAIRKCEQQARKYKIIKTESGQEKWNHFIIENGDLLSFDKNGQIRTWYGDGTVVIGRNQGGVD